MGLMKKFFQQTRKPEGFLGKMMVGGMNGASHTKLADWGMSHLGEMGPAYIAELGCGGGRNAGELLKRYPSARLTALDYSDVSVAKAREYNKQAIKEGRCSVVQGNVTKLPFDDETIDLVTSNYVYHNIPSGDRQAILLETLRTLKKGGTFAIHDIMSRSKYGDMEGFVKKLELMGYEDVQLIKTDNGKFIKPREAGWTGLSGSAILYRRK